jgi:hypothetical protein
LHNPFHLGAVGGPRIPCSKSGYCHLVFPFVSFFLLTSSFLSFISLFPFFHLWSLFLKSYSVNHLFTSSGGYLSVVRMFLSNASFASWSAFFYLEGNSRSFLIQHFSNSLCLWVIRWFAAFSCHYRAKRVHFYHYFVSAIFLRLN